MGLTQTSLERIIISQRYNIIYPINDSLIKQLIIFQVLNKHNLQNMVKYKKPLEDNFLCKLFHIHAFALLYKRLFGKITPSDFYDLSSDAQPDKLKQKFITAKNKIPQSKRTLVKIIMEVFKAELILGILMSFIVAFLLLQSPLIMKTILEYIEKPQVSLSQTNKVKQYVWTWLIVFFIKVFFTEMTDRIFFRIGVKIQLLLTTLFMQKIVKIPNLEGDTKKAQIMNYLIVQIKKIHIFFKKGSWLFSQPPVLLLAILVVFLEGKQFGMLLFMVLFVMVVINMIIDSRMDQFHHHKQEYQGKRINTGIQLLKQHRILKTLGWQRMIPEAANFFRQRENKYNRKYILYKKFNETLLVVTSSVFFCVLFSIRTWSQLTSFTNLTLADVFTMAIFIYILKAPIKNIRYVMTYFYDMMESVESIGTFLKEPELKKINIVSYQYKTGTLVCQNVVARNIADNSDSQQEMMNIKTLVMKKRLSIQQNMELVRNDLFVNLQIKIQKGDKVSITSGTYEGSTFLAIVAGITNYDDGIILYGGRMTYQNSQIWFMEDSILQNILIGRPINQKRLKLVYEVTQLDKQIQLFLFRQRTKITENLYLSQGQKRKIMLARTLYTQADIYLLDLPFKGLTYEASNRIMTNIKIHFLEQTFLVNTNYPQLSGFDHTLIFHQGKATQYISVESYLSSKQVSMLSSFNQQKSQVQIQLRETLGKQKLLQKKLQNRIQIAKKMKKAVRHMLNVLKIVGRERLLEMISKNDNLKGYISRKDDFMQERRTNEKPNQEIIGFLMKNLQYRAILAVVSILTVCEAIKLIMNILFAELIFQSRVNIHKVTLQQYFGLTILLFTLQIFWGIIEFKISDKISTTISKQVNNSLQNAPSSEIQRKDIYDLTEDSNRDYEQIFMLTHRSFLCFSNVVVFLNTICLVLYIGPSLMLVLAILMIFNILFFRHLLITKRDISKFKHKIMNQSYSAVAELVNGISTLRHQADLPYFVQKQIDFVKDYAVYILNQRFSLHAMKIVSELSTLIMTFWVMNYAVNHRQYFFGYEIAILFTTIFYCVKLSGLVYLIAEQASEIDNILQVNIIPSMKILDLPSETSESNLNKPDSWPKINSLVFQNVTFIDPISTTQIVKDINFSIDSGERVAMFGNVQSGIEQIIGLINKQYKPSQKEGVALGKILIGEQNLKYIDKQYVREQVFRLSTKPFIMTASLRTNIDPFNQYRDRDILRMMDLVGLKKFINSDIENVLDYRVIYQNCNEQLKQSIDIVRALLRKPSILISEMINNPEAQEVLCNYLNNSTIIFVNCMIKSIKKNNCSKILYFWKGVLAENGFPSDVLKNKNSFFVKKYLQTYQIEAKQKAENVRKRENSKVFKSEQVVIPV